MTPENFDVVAVTLSIVPTLEERIGDWLLEREDVIEFAGRSIDAHRADGRGLTLAEQVTGRQRRAEVSVQLQAAKLDDWLAALRASFDGGDVQYFVTPILALGDLRDPQG